MGGAAAQIPQRIAVHVLAAAVRCPRGSEGKGDEAETDGVGETVTARNRTPEDLFLYFVFFSKSNCARDVHQRNSSFMVNFEIVKFLSSSKVSEPEIFFSCTNTNASNTSEAASTIPFSWTVGFTGTYMSAVGFSLNGGGNNEKVETLWTIACK